MNLKFYEKQKVKPKKIPQTNQNPFKVVPDSPKF